MRKNADELKKALENVVVPMFCCTSIGLPEDQLAKINKVRCLIYCGELLFNYNLLTIVLLIASYLVGVKK